MFTNPSIYHFNFSKGIHLSLWEFTNEPSSDLACRYSNPHSSCVTHHGINFFTWYVMMVHLEHRNTNVEKQPSVLDPR